MQDNTNTNKQAGMKEDLIYLDTSATTMLDAEVFEVMKPYMSTKYGNAGSMHTRGLEAAHALNIARQEVAKILGAQEKEVIFTGSGTESINMALKGVAWKYQSKGNHIISCRFEHHAVLETLEYLESIGFEVSYLDIDKEGFVRPEDLKAALKPSTILVSIMYANNEIGTIQPIKELAGIAHEQGVLFHTDACQAANSETLNVNELGVDLLSLNGSKLYGPKGVGCLYKKHNVRLVPLIHGGGQEFGLRSGTENIPAIVGFAKALSMAQENREAYVKALTPMRDRLIEGLLKIPDTMLNGSTEHRLANNVNITFLNIEGEAVLLMLDKENICASSGSACTSKSLDPSHVILALGRPYEAAHGSIRFTLSKYTNPQGIEHLIKVMPGIVELLRGMSPVHLTLEEIQHA